jgi:SAM-dependent methyltransferase
MSALATKTLQRAKRRLKLASSKLLGKEECTACGFRGRFDKKNALWPELISEWQLPSQWAEWFNEREGQSCPACGSNLRSIQLAKAILQAIQKLCGATAQSLKGAFAQEKVHELRIAEINSAGALHPFLAQIPNLAYSEYCSTSPGIPSEDLMKLSYADCTFDLVITSETLEHVPDVDVALKEIHRILKPGGMHVFTTPIVWDRPTKVRASIKNGTILHHHPPSYHGGPCGKQTDFLVFNEFGADILERCDRCGFKISVLQDERNQSLAALLAEKL